MSILEPSYLQFFGDDFLRLLLLRYVFCDVVLHLHRGFRGRQYRPRCQPPLPEAELLEHPSLQHLVLDLAAHLEVRTHFMDNHELDWSRAKSSWQCVGFNRHTIESSSRQESHEDRLVNGWHLIVKSVLIIKSLIFIIKLIINLIDCKRDGFSRFIWTVFRFFIKFGLIFSELYYWSTTTKTYVSKQQQQQQTIVAIIENVVKKIKRSYAFYFKATATILNLSYFWTPIAFYLISY